MTPSPMQTRFRSRSKRHPPIAATTSIQKRSDSPQRLASATKRRHRAASRSCTVARSSLDAAPLRQLCKGCQSAIRFRRPICRRPFCRRLSRRHPESRRPCIDRCRLAQRRQRLNPSKCHRGQTDAVHLSVPDSSVRHKAATCFSCRGSSGLGLFFRPSLCLSGERLLASPERRPSPLL